VEQSERLNMFEMLEINDESLTHGCLLKAVGVQTEEETWKFAGIASDESKDTDGDVLLKDILDLSYANARGFVNWHHSREPEHQIGFLTKAEIIEGPRIIELEKKFGVELSKTASIFVEGELFRHVKKAQATRDILLSARPGYVGSVALSIDGAIAKDAETGESVKAFIRGVAMTTIPAHVKTLTQLTKSIKEAMEKTDLGKELIGEVLRKGLDFEQAALWLLKKRPWWTYDIASKVVQLTINNQR